MKYLKRSDELEAEWNTLERRRIICVGLGHFIAAQRMLDRQNEILDELDKAERQEQSDSFWSPA